MEPAASADNTGMYSKRCALAVSDEIAISPNTIANDRNGLVLEVLSIRKFTSRQFCTAGHTSCPRRTVTLSSFKALRETCDGYGPKGPMEEQQTKGINRGLAYRAGRLFLIFLTGGFPSSTWTEAKDWQTVCAAIRNEVR